MNLKNLFKDIRKSFSMQKKVDFDDLNLHFVMESLTTLEELKFWKPVRLLKGLFFYQN